MRIALLFRSYGPYHLARLRELSQSATVLPLEFFDEDPDYAWDVQAEKRHVGVQALATDLRALRTARGRIGEVLDQFIPSVLAVPGWSEPLALHALAAAHDRGIRAVLMSDSRAEDTERNTFFEKVKAKII